MTSSMKCLTKECKNKAKSRGLCASCNPEYRKAVKAGLLTEESALAAGIILPKYGMVGPKPKRMSKFARFMAQALEEAKKANDEAKRIEGVV